VDCLRQTDDCQEDTCMLAGVKLSTAHKPNLRTPFRVLCIAAQVVDACSRITQF